MPMDNMSAWRNGISPEFFWDFETLALARAPTRVDVMAYQKAYSATANNAKTPKMPTVATSVSTFEEPELNSTSQSGPRLKLWWRNISKSYINVPGPEPINGDFLSAETSTCQVALLDMEISRGFWGSHLS